ncbi:MAG TPA: flagellar hook capping FlgD N-terminal domain-containing protein [Ideonella sp.]|nr:flagellar hook capping FlgD N-terminal domain-containing protein [Ideonella sp.]
MSSLLNGTSATGSNSSSGNISDAINANGSTSDLFTTLLVAQIRNQNPLEPKDPSEFVNQLTELSQTEAMQNLVSQGTANASMLDSMQVLSLGAQVGSQVTVTTDTVTLADATAKGSFTLTSGSGETALVLTGADGVEHRIELGTQPPGTISFDIDPAARGLAAGPYSIAVDTDTEETPSVQVAGTLSSVRLSATAGVVLDVAGVGAVSPGAVTGFYGH